MSAPDAYVSTATKAPDAHSFDTHTSRWGTASAKWDLLTAPLGSTALSLSVADMEFLTAPAVFQAINTAAQHGIYGYTELFDDFYAAAYRWQKTQHSWNPPRDSAIFFPRIIQCLSAFLSHGINPKKGIHPTVVTLTPAYGPLVEVSRHCGAQIREVPLHSTLDGHYSIDWDSLTEVLKGADLLLWCNPHNPTGRVWTSEELRKLSTLAHHHQVIIFSDDIHADFIRSGKTAYTPLAILSPELWETGLLIQCASPGKTFNTAGLESAVVFAPPPIKEQLEQAKRAMGIHNPNYFAVPATIAAWTQCDTWVDSLRKHIDANLTYAVDYLRSHLTHATVTDPDGTYLIWVNIQPYLRDIPLSQIERSAAVGVSPGESFGEAYRGYIRLNVALPHSQLHQALTRLCSALHAHIPSPSPHENIGVSHDE